MRVGIDTYSYHRFFGEIRDGEEDPGLRWDTWDFLERAAALRADGVSLETCYLRLDDPAWRRELAARLNRHGLEAVLAWGHSEGPQSGLHMGRSAPRLVEMLRCVEYAAELDMPLMRIVVGTFTHWRKEPEAEAAARLAPALEFACRYAAERGVSLAVETHCALSVPALMELVERVNGANGGFPQARLGVVFDTANVVRVGSDLLQAARLTAEHVMMLHVKDIDMAAADRDDPAGWWPCVALGTGGLDLDGALRIFARSGFDGLACVELATLPAGSDEDRMVADGVRWLREAARRTAAR